MAAPKEAGKGDGMQRPGKVEQQQRRSLASPTQGDSLDPGWGRGRCRGGAETGRGRHRGGRATAMAIDQVEAAR
ncbi:hypothetical protein OsI_36132 [Oryza sativa Indica Group]|uniref:Uncharacterized protein n=1 Tax=Oryza sativa subsp. indica TaxID=39946 RepID=B8BKJ4_ORYSI|nr:hypothetical protein OsI_36132 [Oryza sativa Indica Group]